MIRWAVIMLAGSLLSGCVLGVVAAGAGAGVAATTVDDTHPHASARTTSVAQRPSASPADADKPDVLYIHGGTPPQDGAE